MTIALTEQPGSRAGNAKGDLTSLQSRVWRSTGSDDPEAIWAVLKETAPRTITCPVNAITLRRDAVRYSPVGFQKYEFVIDYEDEDAIEIRGVAAQAARDTQLDIGESRMSFATTGGTARICTSIATLARYKAAANPNDAPDFKNAINVVRDGETQSVEGVDVTVPALRWTLSYRHPRAVITNDYIRTLEDMTGTVNISEFKGRAAGEVLFMGANGSQGTASDPTIDYEFIRLPNTTGQTIGDIVGVAKRGHDYLWVLFEEKPDSGAKIVTKVPKFVFVEQVYPYTDFAVLGIG